VAFFHLWRRWEGLGEGAIYINLQKERNFYEFSKFLLFMPEKPLTKPISFVKLYLTPGHKTGGVKKTSTKHTTLTI